MQSLDRQLNTIWVTLFGALGDNGLHGTVRKQQDQLGAIEARLRTYDDLKLQLTTLWRVIQWVGLLAGGGLAYLATGPLSGFLAGLLRNVVQP